MRNDGQISRYSVVVARHGGIITRQRDAGHGPRTVITSDGYPSVSCIPGVPADPRTREIVFMPTTTEYVGYVHRVKRLWCEATSGLESMLASSMRRPDGGRGMCRRPEL